MSGVKYDSGKDSFALLPWDAVREAARVFTQGAKKYAPRNWEEGLEWSRVYSSTMRHLTDWWEHRMTYDPEGTGLRNVAQALWGLMVLTAFELRGAGTDDRPRHAQPCDAARADAMGVSLVAEAYRSGDTLPSAPGVPHLDSRIALDTINAMLPVARKRGTLSEALAQLCDYLESRAQTLRETQQHLADIELALGHTPGATAPELLLGTIANLRCSRDAALWLGADNKYLPTLLETYAECIEGSDPKEAEKVRQQALSIRKARGGPLVRYDKIDGVDPGVMSRGQLLRHVRSLRKRVGL